MKDKILAALCAALTASLFFGAAFRAKDENAAAETTFLLNPAKAAQTDKICVERRDFSVQFVKSGEKWLGNSGEIDFFASKQAVLDIIAAFSAKREVFLQSNDEKSLEKFGLDSKNSTKIAIFSNGKQISQAEFGATDALFSSIYFSTGARRGIFKTKDDFSQFSAQNLSFWADMDLIPEAEKFSPADVLRAEVFDGRNSLAKGDAEGFARRFLSARAGGICPASECKSLRLAKRADFFLKGGAKVSVSFFEREGEFLAAFEKDGMAQNFALSASEWTFERLFPPS